MKVKQAGRSWVRVVGGIIMMFAAGHEAEAHWEPTYYLQGFVGEQEIGVQIDHFQDAAFLRYFTQEDKVDIVLKGDMVSADSTEFAFERWEGDVVVEQVDMEHLRDGSWRGSWTIGAETFEVRLKPILKDLVDHAWAAATEYKRSASPYAWLRTRDVKLKKVGTTRYGKQKIRWLQEPVSGVTGMQVKGKGTDSLNSHLLSQLLEFVDQYYNCGSYNYQGEFSVEDMEIRYFWGDFFSYRTATQSACVELEDMATVHYETVRISTGKELLLEDILFIGEGDVPAKNSYRWFKYRRGPFQEFLLQAFQELYPETFGSASRLPGGWESPVWHLSEDGLVLGAATPAMAQSGEEPDWFVIPFQRLEAYLVSDLMN